MTAARLAKRRSVRLFWTALGLACVGLGAVGVVVPGLPTTPFLLLAAACFLRGSPRLHDRLLAHPRFGPMLRDVREGRGLSARVKTTAVLLVAACAGYALGPGLPPGRIDLRALVAAAAAIGVGVVLRLPTRRDARAGPTKR